VQARGLQYIDKAGGAFYRLAAYSTLRVVRGSLRRRSRRPRDRLRVGAVAEPRHGGLGRVGDGDAALVAFLLVRGVQAKGLQYIDVVVPFTRWRPVMP